MVSTNYCLLCHKRKPYINELKPVYDLINGKLVGYYCEEHYGSVLAHVRQQKERLDAYLEGEKRKS